MSAPGAQPGGASFCVGLTSAINEIRADGEKHKEQQLAWLMNALREEMWRRAAFSRIYLETTVSGIKYGAVSAFVTRRGTQM